MSQPHKVISASPVNTAALAYAAGQAVGGLLEFLFAVSSLGGSGTIIGASVVDRDDIKVPLDLILYDRTFTPSADRTAFAPSDADAANQIGHISVAAADYEDSSTNAGATKGGLSIPFQALGTSLFGQLVARGAGTFVGTGALTVRIVTKEY